MLSKGEQPATGRSRIRTTGIEEGCKLAEEVMDSEEMYDILPGNGQDDYIIAQFSKMLKARLRQLKEQK